MTDDYIEMFKFKFTNGEHEVKGKVWHDGQEFTCVDICDDFFRFMEKVYGYDVLSKFLEQRS